MALEPAGISLQAEGLAKYVRDLDKIDKKQRDVFEVVSKETGKSFAEIERAAKKYKKEIEDLAKAEQRAAREAEKAAKKRIDAARKATAEQKKLIEAQKTARATQQQAFITAGQATIQFAQQIGQTVIESGQLAAQFKGQQIGLNNLAASFGQSGSEIQQAIQVASKGTISGLQAINAANQGLLLGVAKTPEEFANLTNSAVTLGRTLGLGATQSIEQFTSALGRQSLLILDNFGISAKQVNAEIERLAQADFGKARSELTEAQKQATFMKAALSIAGEAAATIGEEAGNAQAAFDRLEASSENLKVTFGALVQPVGSGIANALSQAAKTAQQVFAFLGAGFVGVGTIATGVFGNVISFFKGEATRSIDDILDEAGRLAIDRFKDIASTIEGVSFPNDEAKEFTQNMDNQNQELKEAKTNLQAYQSAIQQAEDLQLSFARAAEDSALKLARANEDIARKQQRSVAKLEERQKKDRDRLLKDQQKRLDKFEASRVKQIDKAEDEIRKERQQAADQRKRDQQKLQRDLQRAQERFNLSQLQSERRFALSERRLRAEGDILALQQLREDRELERQEEKENFDLSKKEQVQSAAEQQKEQAKDLDNRVKELKASLEDQRAELLASFNEQLEAQRQSQIEAVNNQRQGFAEQAADRAIALQREEEDRRISQQRQLEDLGRSLARQEGITAEGTAAIAGELETVFGVDGVADTIMTGFTDRTESDFTKLFEDLEKIVREAEIEPKPIIPVGVTRQATGSGGFGGRIGGLSEFQEGGVVPGPVGSPQIIQAHGGETVLPTHQRSFTMAAPVIPSQSLNVNMSGGFNITGEGQANEQILQAAAQEMTDNFRIAVQRLARRN